MDSKKKPKKKVKSHNKKTIEVIDGLPVTIHEFNVEDIVSEPEDMETPKTLLDEIKEIPQLPDDSSKYLVNISDEFGEADKPIKQPTQDQPIKKKSH